MNTQQLESFLAVAENLNFARAAESLNITQSAVSRQIHALENELDAKLFRRTSRSVSLTPAGISFYEDAKSFMHDLQTATSKLKSHSKSNVQFLTMGFFTPVHCVLSADLLRRCRERFPGLHPLLRIIPHRAILNLLFQGDIDIMFGFQNEVSFREGISYIELCKTPVCCAISAGHPYSDRDSVREEELYTERIILCNSYALPSGAVELQSKMKSHFTPESVYFCDNQDALLTLVKAGYGFGILPSVNVADPAIRAIPFAPEVLTSFGIFYNENTASPVVREFLSLARLDELTAP